MKKKDPKQVLKGFSWIYIFFVVVAAIFAVLVVLVPSIPEVTKTFIKDDINPIVYLEVIFIVNALKDFWYFWLLRRFVNGKSNGNLYMVLLIIGVIGNSISLFLDPKASTINLVIDAVALYFLIKAKNGGKKS